MPFSSTIPNLSASPSVARPMSALKSITSFISGCKLFSIGSGCVNPGKVGENSDLISLILLFPPDISSEKYPDPAPYIESITMFSPELRIALKSTNSAKRFK